MQQTPHLDRLAKRLGLELPTLSIAARRAAEEQERLAGLLAQINPSDTSIVAFGSLARLEWTEGSDVDWTLLVDGSVDPEHFAATQRIQRALDEAGANEPGREKVFGSMAISHTIVHCIGGEEDTNKNITQRILLLLESCSLGNGDAHQRVVRSVIDRYVVEDDGLRRGSGPERIPRFLLNDIVRFWRTIAVDYAYKRRNRAGEGMPLRNVKFRMSRKLIFVAGLLACFTCDSEAVRAASESDRQTLVKGRLQEVAATTPLDVLSQGIERYEVREDVAIELLRCYEQFLTLLADPDKRKHLKDLEMSRIVESSVFAEARKTAHQFDEALRRMFFETRLLLPLTAKFGVF